MRHMDYQHRRGSLSTPLCARISRLEDQFAAAFEANCVPSPRISPEVTGMQNPVIPNRSAWLPDHPQLPDRGHCMHLAWQSSPRWNRIASGPAEWRLSSQGAS
jgi:hypothetical protein